MYNNKSEQALLFVGLYAYNFFIDFLNRYSETLIRLMSFMPGLLVYLIQAADNGV